MPNQQSRAGQLLLRNCFPKDDGKTVFYKDIGHEFLDQNGGLSGEIMPDYLHLSGKGYEIWGKAIKTDLEKLTR